MVTCVNKYGTVKTGELRKNFFGTAKYKHENMVLVQLLCIYEKH